MYFIINYILFITQDGPMAPQDWLRSAQGPRSPSGTPKDAPKKQHKQRTIEKNIENIKTQANNLAWTPSHRYHWHVATPAVSAKKGPHLIEFQLNNTSRGSRMRGGGFVPGGWSLPGAS